MKRLLVFATFLGTMSLAAQDTSMVRDTNLSVRMRDGVVLRADVWRPVLGGPFPVLVYRTPYGKHQSTGAFIFAEKAVRRGYAVVMQDVRGRYASEGEFLPYQQEGRDGYDTIEWAAVQPWSNGAVGTFGLSYPGAVQWLAAVESPPHLKAMAPAMTFASPMQFWYSGGVWDLSWISWIYNNIAPDRRMRLGMQPAAPWDSVRDRLRGTLPLSAMTEFERIAPWYYEWMRHPAYDPWWSWADLTDKYARTNAAVLNLSAWHDDAYGPHGAITNFAGLQAVRRGRGEPLRAALVMGPWTHGIPRLTRTTAGDREYGPAGTIDYDALLLDWMDRHVRGIDNGVDRQKPVRVFILGSNRWIEADGWPVPGIVPDTVLLTRPDGRRTSLLVSDPEHPIVDPHANRSGGLDYRAFADRKDMVVFETPPLDRDLTVIGAMRAELSIAVDAPDTDLWVKVYDVAPDGTALSLMSPGLDVLRVSYRGRSVKRELLRPGRIYEVALDDLLTANTFKRGHRIRVIVMPSFFPHFARNLHTGESEVTAARWRGAGITLHHSAQRPFRLILPRLANDAMLSGDQ